MCTGPLILTARPQVLARTRTDWTRRLGMFFLGLLLISPPCFAAETISKEYQLKAAFLYNFTKFVEWPAPALAAKDSPIIIGVLGKNPFGDELAKLVQERTVNGHPFIVQQLASVNEATNVNLLFVPRGQESLLTDRLPGLQAAGALTVGESEAFAAMAGIVNFTMEADKIRFEINLEEAERGGLKISAQLLKLAKTVRRKN